VVSENKVINFLLIYLFFGLVREKEGKVFNYNKGLKKVLLHIFFFFFSKKLVRKVKKEKELLF